MNEVLSQAEIDSLLDALQSGKLKAEDLKEAEVIQPEIKEMAIKYRNYDFRRPNKFSEDQLRTLQMLHEGYARLLSSFLSGYLRANIVVRVTSVDQFTFDDFVSSVPSPTLLTVFSLPPLDGLAVLETNPQFLFPIIDLLFGGVGRKSNKVKELTEIELRVLKKLIGKLLENMALAWSDVFKFNTIIDSMESNPQYNQIISPNETVAIITFTADVANNESIINLCLPYATLKEAIPNLTAQNWFAAQQYADVSQARNVENRLGKVALGLTACCGDTQLTIHEFLQLEEGDVVLLNTIVGEDMELKVEGHPKFRFQPGIIGNQLAAMITGKL